MFEGAIVDLDGTVYRGGEPIPGAGEAVERLRAVGRVLFVTNNPTRTPAATAADLEAMGVPADPEEILTSTTVTREYLRANHDGAPTFAVAEAGITDQLDGVPLTDDPGAAEVLLAGIDRGFTYDALTDALRALRDPGTAFVGTDPDRTIPGDGGEVVPGSGAIIGAIAATAEREPDAVPGKPSERMIESARRRLGSDPRSWLVIGDRLDTDVAMGAAAGATTALVLTGTHDAAAIEEADVTPDHVLDSIAEVGGLL